MRIKDLSIKNYKGIESLNVSFNSGINLIIGNNGAGKSSLLSAVSVILSEPLLMIRDVGATNISSNDVRISTIETGDSVVNSIANYPVKIDAVIDFNGNEYSCSRIRKNEASIEEFGDVSLSTDFLELFNSDSVAPLICYFCAGRTVVTEGWDNNVIAVGETKKIKGYQHALEKFFNFDSLQEWCLKMEFAEYQKKHEIREYTAFKSIVSAFMKKMDNNAHDPKIYYSSDAGALVYSDGTEVHTVDRLSDGYQSILFMIAELAYRSVILNPLTDNLTDVIKGVVVIDEIDEHLHPAWQWKIIPALQETFPNVQFIIATHSPIILSSAKGSTLMLMKSPDDVEVLQSVYGYSINDVLSLPQGSEDVPKEVSGYYDKAEAIFDRGDEKELKELLEKAEKEFGDYPDVLKNLKEFIDINKWIGEV